MRSHLILILPLLLGISCQLRPREDKIVQPVISSAFYEESVREIERFLRNNPDQPSAIRLQLRYYKELGWPLKAREAVRRARQVLPLDPILARDYADFYSSNELHLDFINLREEMSGTYQAPVWMEQYAIASYNAMGSTIRARELLRDFFNDHDDAESHFWGGKQYLVAGDSVLGIYHLLKAYDDMMEEPAYLEAFVPVAYEQGLTDRIADALRARKDDQLSLPVALVGSKVFYEMGELSRAKSMLRMQPNRSAFFQLSALYLREYKWDSAHFCIDRILIADNSDIEALVRKGEIDETRGWLSQSLVSYRQAWEMDSTYGDIAERLDIVGRKIAYLRRIREAQQEIPTIDLESKKRIQ